MKKPPALNEVFLVQNRNIINIGSAYSRARRRLSEGELRPEFEKIVDDHYRKIMDLHRDGEEPSEEEVKDCLRDMMHDVEAAEGEDPAELDQGGPEPGSTGGGE